MRNNRIVTLTLHAAVDMVVRVRDLTVGTAHECDSLDMVGGGKGWNVARAARDLGCNALAIVAASADYSQLFKIETGPHLQLITVDPGVPTRINITLLQDSGATHLRTSGQPVRENFLDEIRQLLLAHTNPHAFIVFAGSVPMGISRSRFRQLLKDMLGRGAWVAVDTSGTNLRDAIDERVSLIKPNLAELEQLMNKKFDSVEDIANGSRQLCEAGVGAVIVSLGASGAIGTTPDGSWHVPAPVASVLVSDVGAGDALLAGVVTALHEDLSFPEALVRGVAAGTASLGTHIPASINVRSNERFISELRPIPVVTSAQ